MRPWRLPKFRPNFKKFTIINHHVDNDVSLPSTLQGHQIHAFDTTLVI